MQLKVLLSDKFYFRIFTQLVALGWQNKHTTLRLDPWPAERNYPLNALLAIAADRYEQ